MLLDTVVSENNTNKKAKYTAFLHKLYTPIIYNSKEYLAVTTVEEYYDESKNGVSRRAYNLKNIKIESADGRLEKISTSPMSDTDSTTSISDLYALVKGYDKDFKSQPSSKVVNTDGTPKVYITEQMPTSGHSLLQIAERTEKNSVWDITLSITSPLPKDTVTELLKHTSTSRNLQARK